ncbi:MAG: DNA recombination protein RmuC [Bacteroidota bacterium]
MEILFLIIGIVAGIAIGYLIAKNICAKSEQQKEQLLNERINSLDKEKAVLQERTNLLNDENLSSKSELISEREKLNTANNNLAKAEEGLKNMNEKLKEEEERQKKNQTEFKNIANEILETKSQKFTELNKTNLDGILIPLKEQIKAFEEKVDKSYRTESAERNTLKGVIEQLTKLNQQMDQDTKNLTKALKGDSKKQGDWGEKQVEILLEKSGLQKDIHYLIQKNFRNSENELFRPDFIVLLPENKNLIIDSKVSLTAYTDYLSTDDEEKKKTFLSSHLKSVRNHIEDLSQKKYHELYQINSPDYVLMYMPIEYAFFLSVQSDQELFSFGLNKNIILTTTSTLLATLSTVSFIWKQENQKRNVLEIARQSGDLYDKFVGFTADLITIGKKMNDAKCSYEEAMKKLSEGKGNLVHRVEEIKKLGAQTSKSISHPLLERAKEE